MPKKAFIIKILTVLFFFILVNAYAHTTQNTNAELNIFPNNKYDLTIHVDLLHLAKDKLEFQDNDSELINHLSGLSLIETKRLLDSIRLSIQRNSYIYFDENKQAIPVLSGLSVAEFKNLLINLNITPLPRPVVPPV